MAFFVAGVVRVDAFDFARLLGWAVFGHAALLLAGAGIIMAGAHRPVAIAATVLAMLVGVTGVYAYAIEPRWLEVSRVAISSEALTQPLRIALVADIQTDRVGAHDRRAMRALMRERPDVIVFAGDYIQARASQNGPQALALRDVLADEGVGAPLGAYAVKGNVDGPPWTQVFEGLGYEVRDQTHTVTRGPISITALSEADSFDLRASVPPAPGFHIVVGHSPDFALGDVQADLLLAGHTHGGQVRLPLLGPVMNASHLPRSAAAGMTALSGGRTLVVSRGVGMERDNAPRLRFLCRPEIVIIDVTPA